MHMYKYLVCGNSVIGESRKTTFCEEKKKKMYYFTSWILVIFKVPDNVSCYSHINGSAQLIIVQSGFFYLCLPLIVTLGTWAVRARIIPAHNTGFFLQ